MDQKRRLRLLYFAVAWISFAVGVVGALLPLLPTTPFMLISLWAFSRSSQRFHDWLYHHPWLGRTLRNWHTNRVVPWSVRITAYVSMLASLSYTAFVADFPWWIPAATAVLVLVGIGFISRCPTHPPTAEPSTPDSTPRRQL